MRLKMIILFSAMLLASCKKEIDQQTQKLMAADWRTFESRLNVTPPLCLKEFYGDPDKVGQRKFEIPIPAPINGSSNLYVEEFLPIDDLSVMELSGGGKYLKFANNGSGRNYIVDPKSCDSEVFSVDITSNLFAPRRTGLTLTQFLAGKR